MKLEKIREIMSRRTKGPWVSTEGGHDNWWDRTIFGRGGPKGQTIICQEPLYGFYNKEAIIAMEHHIDVLLEIAWLSKKLYDPYGSFEDSNLIGLHIEDALKKLEEL